MYTVGDVLVDKQVRQALKCVERLATIGLVDHNPEALSVAAAECVDLARTLARKADIIRKER